jgi:hypothetical protein
MCHGTGTVQPAAARAFSAACDRRAMSSGIEQVAAHLGRDTLAHHLGSVAPPGSNELTVTPVPARSCAHMMVSDSSAALDGPYGEKAGPAHRLVIHRDVDDAPPALLEHVRHDRTGHQKGSIDVGIDDHPPHRRIGLPEVGRRLQESLADEAHPAAGIVHQDVNGTELADGAAHHEQTVLFVGDIRRSRMNRSRQPAPCGFIGNRVDFRGGCARR